MRPIAILLLLSRGCSELEPVDTDPDPDSHGDADTDTDADSDSDNDTDTDEDTLPPGNMETLSGDLTWTIDFDATAEAAGAVDCTYTRHYEAEQDSARDWLCPECDLVFLADVSFVDGQTSCYRQITTGVAPPNELLARTSGRWWRSRDWNLAPVNMGSAQLRNTSWTVSGSGSAPHTTGYLDYTIEGTLERSAMDGELAHDLVPPDTYTCGWDVTERPAYTGANLLAVGRALPDVVLYDRCGEPVRLYDLFSGYLVLWTATTDCAQCRSMGQGQFAFQQYVNSLGWDVTIVTLLSPTLVDAAGDVSIPALNAWATSANLSGGIVLRDRGYGFHVVGDAFPGSVVVGPDGTVIDIAEGFPDETGWDYWGLQIDQHIHGED